MDTNRSLGKVEDPQAFVLTPDLCYFSAPGMDIVEQVLDILLLDPLVMDGELDILSWTLQVLGILSLSLLV